MSGKTPGGLLLPDKDTLELVKRITWPQRCEEPSSVPDGLRIDAGYLSPYFVTDPKRFTAELDKALVLAVERPIVKPEELVPILDNVARAGKALLVAAPAIEDEVHAFLVLNKLRGMLRVCAVAATSAGSIANYMRSKIISGPIEAVGIGDLGSARRVSSGMKSTVIIRAD